jgi:hypothetical protein
MYFQAMRHSVVLAAGVDDSSNLWRRYRSDRLATDAALILVAATLLLQQFFVVEGAPSASFSRARNMRQQAPHEKGLFRPKSKAQA